MTQRFDRHLFVVMVGLGLALTAVLSTAVLLAIRVGVQLAPALPRAVDLTALDDLTAAIERDLAFPSTVLAADGSVIGRFKSSTIHRRLPPGDLPEPVVRAVLAAEDDEFWSHAGFDPSAILRAFASNVSGSIEQGGSTITQQVAKMLFTGDDDSLERKIAELRTALEIERRFSKPTILRTYLDSVYFGNGAFGVAAAARTYFHTSAADLSLAQAALLAGIIPAPTTFDPRAHPDAAEFKRQHVLDRLEALGWATDLELAEARAARPTVQPPLPAVERFPYFLDYVRRFLLDVVGMPADQLFGGGLEIRTTLDPHLQQEARGIVARHLPDPGDPAAAVAVIDHRTGAVLALVGGRDFASSKVNLALGELGGGSGRQTGSAFKPFVLGTALEQGYSLTDRIAAPAQYLPRTVPDPRPVHNYTRRGYGVVTLAEAMRRSINTAFVALGETVGTAAVAHFATDAGIESLPKPSDVGPSIAIGAYETSPLQMAAAYGTFAADGRRVHVSPIISVSPPELDVGLIPMGRGQPVMSGETARLVTAALRGVVESGTARVADLGGRPVAAKTGTSNDYANAWLVGYSAQLATAVWMGVPSGNVPMLDVHGVPRVTGGSLPARIWRDVMSVAHEGRPVRAFPAAPERRSTTTQPPTTRPPTTRASNTRATAPAPSTTASPTTTTAPAPSTTASSTTTTAPAPSTTASSTTTAPTSTTPPSDRELDTMPP